MKCEFINNITKDDLCNYIDGYRKKLEKKLKDYHDFRRGDIIFLCVLFGGLAIPVIQLKNSNIELPEFFMFVCMYIMAFRHFASSVVSYNHRINTLKKVLGNIPEERTSNMDMVELAGCIYDNLTIISNDREFRVCAGCCIISELTGKKIKNVTYDREKETLSVDYVNDNMVKNVKFVTGAVTYNLYEKLEATQLIVSMHEIEVRKSYD